jgi:hypothetical protein
MGSRYCIYAVDQRQGFILPENTSGKTTLRVFYFQAYVSELLKSGPHSETSPDSFRQWRNEKF